MKKLLWPAVFSIFIILTIIYATQNTPKQPPGQEASEPAESEFSATDSRGEEITLDQKPQRVVSLAPANTEILFALGLDEEIVGITDFCDYPPEKVARKERIGGFADPNLEKIISLSPEIVFATSGVQAQAVERLEDLGVKVYVLEAETVENLLVEVEDLGRLMGKSQEALALVERLEGRVKVVEEKVGDLSDDQKPRVFLEIWHDPLWTAPNRTLIYQIVELAGGTHSVTIEGDWNQVTTVDAESVISADPEFIFLAFENSDPELVYKLPGWRAVSAVKNRKVFQLDPDIIARPGPRIVDALEQIAKILHPDLF